MSQGEIVIYQSDNLSHHIEVRIEDDVIISVGSRVKSQRGTVIIKK